ncbi:hypothetical protein KV697_00490 [Sphingomonas sanguinis]|uniref:PepSY domain-containing protein n=1 Tax=Sphingomonas sanguinis TaxID=33051 RepID=A0ABU5LTP8_9SPHN|nr:hypothetical protein [Sphingomonas sanguinis]MDZ7283091.1 hypothetical protein [Sphingomonas sanguinis]QXT35925.1 hypothetical protein KV697_00490 [Sphingomonas sanguinis]
MAFPSSSPRSRGQWARALRRCHRLIGLFFTPAILFFAVTGALQTLELHEVRHGPVPAWLAAAASLHKHQRLSKPKPPAAVAASASVGPASPALRDHTALRLFVVLMAIALAVSALSGCAIALHLRTTRREAVIVLVAGVVAPIILYAL